ALESPDALALESIDGARYSYAELWDQVTRVVAELNAAGVGRGDRVALVLGNGPELAAAFLGIATGAACAPLNPGYRAPEFDFYLGDLGAKAVVVGAGMESPVRDAARRHGIPLIELVPGQQGTFTLRPERPVDGLDSGLAEPGDVALVLHTSGTTARPKAVPLAHA